MPQRWQASHVPTRVRFATTCAARRCVTALGADSSATMAGVVPVPARTGTVVLAAATDSHKTPDSASMWRWERPAAQHSTPRVVQGACRCSPQARAGHAPAHDRLIKHPRAMDDGDAPSGLLCVDSSAACATMSATPVFVTINCAAPSPANHGRGEHTGSTTGCW